MFYLTTHSTHFIYVIYGAGHMVQNHSDREIGYSFRLATKVLRIRRDVMIKDMAFVFDLGQQYY